MLSKKNSSNQKTFFCTLIFFLLNIQIFTADLAKKRTWSTSDDAAFALCNIEHLLRQIIDNQVTPRSELLAPFYDSCVTHFIYEPAQQITAMLRSFLSHSFITIDEFIDIVMYMDDATENESSLDSLDSTFEPIMIQISKFLSWRNFTQKLLRNGERIKSWSLYGIKAYLKIVCENCDVKNSATFTVIFLDKAFDSISKRSDAIRRQTFSMGDFKTTAIFRPISISASMGSEASEGLDEHFQLLLASVGSYRPIDREEKGFCVVSTQTEDELKITHHLSPFSTKPDTTAEEGEGWDFVDRRPTRESSPFLTLITESAQTACATNPTSAPKEKIIRNLCTKAPIMSRSENILWHSMTAAATTPEELRKIAYELSLIFTSK